MKKMILTIAAVLSMATMAYAIPYGFEEITSNSPINVASQLSVDVSASSGNILFKFTNTGSLQSVITDIYFDWGTTTSFPLLWVTPNPFTTTGTVAYTVNTKNNVPNLPAGNTISFEADRAANPDSPSPTWGINNFNNSGVQDSLTIAFTSTTQTFDQILSALDDDAFRIGVHVQSLSDEKSESYVNGDPPTPPVPEPGTIVLLGAGFLGLAAFGRKRIKK